MKAQLLNPNELPKDQNLNKVTKSGTNMFIGGLPVTTTNAQLLKMLTKIGEVSKVQIKYDTQKGTSMATAYFKAQSPTHAARLLETLVHFPDRSLRCQLQNSEGMSKGSRRLFVGGIPKSCSDASFKAQLEYYFGNTAYAYILRTKER